MIKNNYAVDGFITSINSKGKHRIVHYYQQNMKRAIQNVTKCSQNYSIRMKVNSYAGKERLQMSPVGASRNYKKVVATTKEERKGERLELYLWS